MCKLHVDVAVLVVIVEMSCAISIIAFSSDTWQGEEFLEYYETCKDKFSEPLDICKTLRIGSASGHNRNAIIKTSTNHAGMI